MSPVDICNQALAHLCDRRISRLDDDAQISDALVRYCSEFYATARQEALAAHRWTFAKKAQALSLRSDITFVGFSYAHQLPEDLIRLMRIVPGSQATLSDGSLGPVTYLDVAIDSFKIVGKQVWSDYPQVAVEYIKDSTNPSDWTPHFRAAVARLLASYLAGPVADSPNEAAEHLRVYETVSLPNAQYYDAVQDQSGENSDQQSRLALSPTLRSRYNNTYGSSSSATSLPLGTPSTTTAPDLDGIAEEGLP